MPGGRRTSPFRSWVWHGPPAPTSPAKACAASPRETDAWVGVTLGADGFLWRDGATEHRAPAPAVKAIDTLGAGDVWHGAFTLALAERMPVGAAARFANAAAAIKCTRFGGRGGAPRRDEVEALLAG